MTALDIWLKQATRHLAENSILQVRQEIREHYESAREAAMSNGAPGDEADRMAVTALGDAKVANCQYRKVLLTSAEARILRSANREAQAVCSRAWLRWGLLGLSAAALAAGAFMREPALLAGGTAIAFLFSAPFLPIYTPVRARVFRSVKWVLIAGTVGLAFSPDTLKWSWLLVSCLWPLVSTEWSRISIRRKLPVGEWPRQLYL